MRTLRGRGLTVGRASCQISPCGLRKESVWSPCVRAESAPKLSSLKTNTNFSSPQSAASLRSLQNLCYIEIFSKDPDGYIDECILSSISSSLEVILGEDSFRKSTLLKIGTGELLPLVESIVFYENDIQTALDRLATRFLIANANPERISQIKAMKIYCDDDFPPSVSL
ncbi:hypothetical protein BDZ94DRAFT_1315510 [Collybia nuda]|uniref:Uncharacterized protein n=1 Tax=Collybia nuda TaxID=64659 RepID=A0A9P5XUS0_9AGAR|nr:hypothetical protein BDZ94DRAFT_1315510 [Collybia nuda]